MVVPEAETELVALCRDADHVDGAIDPKEVVTSFLEEICAKHRATDAARSHASATRRNQLRLYLDPERRATAASASLHHLESHSDWTTGQGSLSPGELRSRVALQHFTSIDLEDLTLPADERRSSDAFDEDGMCEQFVLDAGRSIFVVDGEEYNFASEVEASGVNQEDDPLAIERMLRAFERRLTGALSRQLGAAGGGVGVGAPRALVQAISRAMSQSGMANLERSCAEPQVVVCGGSQSLRYELAAAPSRSPGGAATAWEVHTSMIKEQFEECVVIHEESSGAREGGSSSSTNKVVMLRCDPSASRIQRGCLVKYEVDGEGSGVVADVCSLTNRIELFDELGDLISLSALALRGPEAGDDLQQQQQQPQELPPEAWSLFSYVASASRVVALKPLLGLCFFCRRRAGHVASAITGLLPWSLAVAVTSAGGSGAVPVGGGVGAAGAGFRRREMDMDAAACAPLAQELLPVV